MKNKYALGIILITIFLSCLAPLAVIKNPLFLGLNGYGSYLNFAQRVGGLIAFVLVVLLILLGTAKLLFSQKTPVWVESLHKSYGFLAIFLVFIHPLMLLILNYLYRKVIDPFYVFSDFCLLCETKTDLFLTLGRVSFWALGIIGLSVMLKKQNWWKDNWMYLHYSSYVVFFFIAVHAYKLGSDVHSLYFLPIFIVGLVLVILSIPASFWLRKK